MLGACFVTLYRSRSLVTETQLAAPVEHQHRPSLVRDQQAIATHRKRPSETTYQAKQRSRGRRRGPSARTSQLAGQPSQRRVPRSAEPAALRHGLRIGVAPIPV